LGETIAFLSQRTGFYEIWLVRPDGQELRQLTHLGMDVADIAWSPDGKRLACTVNRGGAFELALVEAGNGAVTTLRSGQGYHARPNWSPRGDFLTFEYESPTQPPDLYRMHPETRAVAQLTFSNPPALACLEKVTPRPVIYRSFDGLEIPAFLYQPAKPNGAAIVNPHGGPSGQYIYDWDGLAQYLVAKGYTCLAPNYRGSTGYGREFERLNYNDWGIGDAQDCLHGARYLHQLGGIDAGRIAIFGGSYGGYMTVCCLSRDPEYLFACGISKYGDSNLTSSWAQCCRRLRLYTEVFLGHPGVNRQVYLDGSPIYQVENVQKPVLILHGLLDDVVPPQASEEWVEALRRAGKTFEYKTYADEPHGFLHRKNQLDAYGRIERFLDWYLLPGGSRAAGEMK
jgi:dipeptidyl aminopeptidase/acylaminoacyl peptidase